MNAAPTPPDVRATPWFTNDRGAVVMSVTRGDKAIGWYAPHPTGFYGERDSWPCGSIVSTRPTESAMLDWIGGAR